MAVEIEWIDSTSPAATGNKIYRDTVPSTGEVEIADVPNGTQFYSDSTVAEGTDYKFEVQAHDGAGDETTREEEGKNMDYITTAGSSFDADYQAILTQAGVKGYALPSTAQQDIQNQLVIDLKAAGIWAKLDCMYIPANDGSKGFGYLNWLAPTLHEATINATVDWTSNVGLKPPDLTGYVNTNWNPTTDGSNYLLNSCSIFMFQHDTGTPTTSWRVPMGGRGADADSKTFIFRDSGGLGTYLHIDSSAVQVSSTATGLLHGNRKSDNTVSFYLDGVINGTENLNPNAMADLDMYICGQNNQGAHSSPNNCGFGVAGFGGDLSAEAATFSSLINAYIAAI